MILAMTVKGYGTGEAGEANNETHSLKKLDMESLKAFRDRFDIPISDEDLENVPYYRPPPDSPEMRYMRERRAGAGRADPGAARRDGTAGDAAADGLRQPARRAAARAKYPPPWRSCACCPAW